MAGGCKDDSDCVAGMECSHTGICISSDTGSGTGTGTDSIPCAATPEPADGCGDGQTWLGEPFCKCVSDAGADAGPPGDGDIDGGGDGGSQCDCTDFYICLDDDCTRVEFLTCCEGGCPEGYECREDIALNSERSDDPEWVECCFPKCVYGCTNVFAINWDEEATCDDGSCIYLEPPDEVVPPSDPADASPRGGETLANCAEPEGEAQSIETYQTCFPNPLAPVPNWITQPEGEPFLNQKTCQYSIVILADPPECSEEYFNTFLNPAVSNLLSHYNKETRVNFTNIETSMQAELSSLDVLTVGSGGLYFEGLQFAGLAQVKDFYIPPQPKLKTRILVTVWAEEFNRIPEKADKLLLSEPVSAMVGEVRPSFVVFSTKEIIRIFDVVSRSFRFFEVPYVEWSVGTGKIIKGLDLIADSNRIEKFYGDLSALIEESGYSNIFALDTIKIDFDDQYKITSVKVTEPYSQEVEIEIGFESFINKPLMSNATIMAYISRLPDIKEDLMSREPPSWYDLLAKYRFPAIEESYISDLSSPLGEENEGLVKLSEAACPAGSSAFEPKKTPGQWLAAEANSIMQALINKLSENPCALVDARILESQGREDLVMQVVDLTLKEYLSSDRIINDLPVMIVNGQWKDIAGLYRGMIDNLGYCGFIDLIKMALDCLLNALGYEDSISLIVGAAIRGMDNEQFAKLLVKLPPELLEIFIASVRETAPDILPFLQSLIIIEIVDDDGIKITPVHDKTLAYSYTSEGAYQATAPEPSPSSPFVGSAANTEYPPPTAEDWVRLNQVFYDLVIEKVFSAESLLEVLETFPGASMVVSILEKMDKFCIAPPRFYPPLNDFMRLPGVNIDLCALGEGGLITPIPGSLELPKLTLAGISNVLIDNAFRLLQQITKLALILILRRIIEIIYEELCKNRADSDPLGLRDALMSKCGNALSDDELNQAIADLGQQSGCFKDPVALGRFIDNVSSVLTECEFVDLVKGVARDNVYDLVLQVMKVDPITLPLVECYPDRDSIQAFFKSIGIFVDLDSLCIIQPSDVPFSQDVCDDMGLLALFRDTRAQALRDKGIDEECINDQLCKLRDRTMSNLEDMMQLLHGGLEGLIPDFVTDPDSETPGLLPSILPGTEIFTNSIFDSMFAGLETEFTQDIIGRRGFLNMCLADSRGRGYIQHMTFQKMFGPSTFNIYGSRGTRTHPPRDEWSDKRIKTQDHNDWATEPIPFSEDATKFMWLPYLFNPLSSIPPEDGENPIEEEEGEYIGVDGSGNITEQAGEVKGRPPAIGGLPDKVAGWLQKKLTGFTTSFSTDGTWTITQIWEDYDFEHTNLSYTFNYDYHVDPPEGREDYNYDGYRLRVEKIEDGIPDVVVSFKTEDPLLPEVSTYIEGYLTPPGSSPQKPDDHWADFMFNKIDRVTEDIPASAFKTEFRNMFESVSAGFIEMMADDISKTDIFDYGFNRDSIPEVVYFHEDGMSKGAAIERYGGSEGNPPFYIKEPEAYGFTKVARAIIPEIQICDESEDNVDFPKFSELKDAANSLLGKIKDDPRLSKCNGSLLNVIEAPFDRALPAASKALNEALIYATIRTYIVEFMLKSLPVFNFMRPGYPNNYTNLLVEYIVEYMERGLKQTGRGASYREDYETYWFIFLEQVVQSFKLKYETKVKASPPEPVATGGDGSEVGPSSPRKRLLDDASEAEKAALAKIVEEVESTWKYYRNRKDPGDAEEKKEENWRSLMRQDKIQKNCKVILRRYIGEELERMSGLLEDILPKTAPYPIYNVNDLVLLSETRKTPELSVDAGPYASLGGLYRVPYVAGAVNRREAGPVDVPGTEYYKMFGAGPGGEKPHPLDIIGGALFEDRKWPFVLERYFKTDDVEATEHQLGEVINIFDWEDFVEKTGKTIPPGGEWKFGMRLSFVPSEAEAEAADFGNIEDNLFTGIDYTEKAYSKVYKNLIPMVSVELPIIEADDTYTAGLYSNYVQPLLCKLVEETEYKLLFTHIYPLARYISFLSVYVSNTFVPSMAQIKDGWAATNGGAFGNRLGGGRWIGIGKFGGMRTWRGDEGDSNALEKTKAMARQLLEASCSTNYNYRDRDELSPKQALVRANKSSGNFDPGLKWWQWSSLRPAPCKKEEE